jgi:hypothetical protein
MNEIKKTVRGICCDLVFELNIFCIHLEQALRII